MKKIYMLSMHLTNGTVTTHTDCAAFTDRDLAEKVSKTIEEKNAGNGIAFWNEINEVVVYEKEEEVPILNER